MINYFRIGGYTLLAGLALWGLAWLSGIVKQNYQLRTNITSLEEEVKSGEKDVKAKNQIIADQNNEIKAKDKFIENLEKKRNEIRIKKQIIISKPLSEQYKQLLERCKDKVC